MARNLSIEAAFPVQAVDPDDPTQSRQAAAALLAMMQRAGHEKLAVDITGGKTPMSLGAFMAAEEAGAASLYVASGFDVNLRKPDMRTARVRVISLPGRSTATKKQKPHGPLPCGLDRELVHFGQVAENGN